MSQKIGRKLILGATVAIFAGVPCAGFAQDNQAPVIVVTGEGLPVTPATPAYDVQTINRTALVSTASGRIEDALSNIAGFQQFRRSDSRSSNPSAQGATLRSLGGNATSRALVLLDGVPMADPFFGYIPFSAIAPERLASVRVTRGGGSGPFGAGALAGTIEMVSADARQLAAVQAQGLVNDRGETETSASLAWNGPDGFGTVSGRWDRGKGFFTTPEAERVDATARAAYDAYSVSARGVVSLSNEVELQARGLAFRDSRTLRFEGANNLSEGQDGSIRLVGRGDWQFDALAYVQERNFANVVISSTRFVPVLDQRYTPSSGVGGKLELRPPTGDHNVLRLGGDFRRAKGELFETALSAFTGAVTANRNAGGINTDLGLFAENDMTLGALTLTAGARVDRYTIRGGFYEERDANLVIITDERFADRAGWAGSFRGGALFRPSDGIAFRTAAYTGLRLPTLNELYRPFVVLPVTTLANPGLSNEKLEGYEVGVDITPSDRIGLSLTAFDNTVKNATANVTIGENLRQRRNIDAIDARGVEATASLDFGAMRFDASAAYTDAKARGSGLAAALDGKRPSQTPKLAASGTLTWRPGQRTSLSATLRHVGKQYEDDLEADVLPAATTLDAFAQIDVLGGVSLVLRAENIFNEIIITRNQAGSMDYGTPRTVWGGVRIGF